MAVTTTTQSYRVVMLLDVGTSAEGKVITKSVSIGSLDPLAIDNEKAMTVANLLEAILQHDIYTVRATKVETLREV